MQNIIIDKLIQGYLRVYLNPRATDVECNIGNWFLRRDYEHSLCHQPAYQKSSASCNLEFLFNNEKFVVYQIDDAFFGELNSWYKDIDELNSWNEDIEDEGIYNIINSLLTMFYLPYGGFSHDANFVHQKPISFLQLALSDDQLSLNDNMRLKYIKNLFYNSFLMDELSLLDFKNGVLLYNKKSLRVFFINIQKSSTSLFFKEIVSYCLSMIEFMENGLKVSDLSFLLDDVYLNTSHYTYFLSKEAKPYKYKKMVAVLYTMYSDPKTTSSQLVNKMFLLNFLLLEQKAEFYIQKYVEDKEVFNEITDDINFLKRVYIQTRIFR